ncbi:MAG TPA: serine/threonine-protein kinase [Candidatus Angelobacter sp.]|jgi:predicted Ser/Thr protein kinase
METKHFIELRKVFDAAVLLSSPEWPGFLREACNGNESIYAEAMDLLLAHQNAGTAEPAGEAKPLIATRMIGPYRILRELGAGGMGLVYLAVRDDGTFRKNVALKLLKSHQATQDFIQRFHQERQVLANLDHPNIARMLDGGQTADGLPYLVMEYVDGLPLGQFCDTQKLDLADRIRLFQQVVSAVSYLHENLVVHRDLKPSNILVTGDGQVKLLDFGIAKTQAPFSQVHDLTGPTNRLLTPTYASPEQMGGAPIARASDIYSLGVILYELLTGRLPYKDSTSKLTEEPPLPSANIRNDLQRTPETTAQLRRRIVGDLDQIVLLCLRRDPRHRYPSARALTEDLGRFLDGRSVLARKGPLLGRTLRFLKRNRMAVAVCLLILLSLGVGTWQTVTAQIHARMAEVREAEMTHVLDVLDQRNTAKQSTGPARVEDIRKLRGALDHDLVKAWSLRPGLTPERKALLERTSRYLDSLLPYVAQNAMLAVEVAGAYQELGTLCEPVHRDYALLAYRNAAQVLEQASSGDPDHGPVRRQWVFIAGRIMALGGTIPVYVPPPPPDAISSAERKRAAPALPHPPAEEESSPVMPVPSLPAPDPAEYEALRSRLDAAASKAEIAEDYFAETKKDLEAKHEVIHPDIAGYDKRMQNALESARRALEGGDLAAAGTNIDIATECARRVMKAVGR